MSVRLIHADCRVEMPKHGPFDMIVADPPYGDTSLKWDKKVKGWTDVARACLKPTGSLWVFGSMRYFLAEGVPPGFRLAQDIVWEKHNGSGFHADRFKRVHEHAVQFYRDDAPWVGVFNEVQRIAYEGQAKNVPNNKADRAGHAGKIAHKPYVDDGTRIVRSVIREPQPRDGSHETQKPVALLCTIIRTSCPPAGLVGDFFAGSGAAGEAAGLCGRSYVGCEIDPKMAAKAQARLSGHLWAGAA